MVQKTIEVGGREVIVEVDDGSVTAREVTEKERFKQYLDDHEQVVDYEEHDDAELADTVINVGYKHADRVGYNNHPDKQLDLTDFPNCNVLYLEKNKWFDDADTFVQVDVGDEE